MPDNYFYDFLSFLQYYLPLFFIYTMIDHSHAQR